MPVQARGAGFQSSVMLGGTRYRPQFDTEKAALEWEAEARAAHREGRPIPEAVTQAKRGGGTVRTIEDVFNLTCRRRWDHLKSGPGLTANGRMFVDWIGGNKPVSSITTEDLDAYVDYLEQDRGASGATVNRKCSAVQVMFKEASRRGLETPPLAFDRRRESRGSLNWLDFGEEDAILAELHRRGMHRLADLCVFLLDTGARVSDALRLSYRTIRGAYITFENRKNGAFSAVPMTARCKEVVQRCRVQGGNKDLPFGDLNYNTIIRQLRAVLDYLGGTYAQITQPFHVFRHSCASRLATRGVDAMRIKEWMDHSSLITTQRYMKLAPKSLDAAAEALEA